MFNYIVLFISTFLISFISFKYFVKKEYFLIKEKDEFTHFVRKKIQNCSGIIFILVFIVTSSVFLIFNNSEYFLLRNYFYFSGCLLIISIISFIDDLKNLDPILRLIIHCCCCYVALTSVPHMVDYLPIKLNILLALISWIYIVNITNFIDGADGFCVTNVIFFTLTTLIICLNFDLKGLSFVFSTILLPILIIFLFYNKPPAKLFMGDVGAISLGFFVGYNIIELTYYGYFFLAISAYAYPLTDCSITLIRKAYNGYLPWKRLGDYFFLKPKKKTKKNNDNLMFYKIEKKIFKYLLLHKLFSLLTVIFAIIYDTYFIALLSFASAIILIKKYSNFSAREI